MCSLCIRNQSCKQKDAIQCVQLIWNKRIGHVFCSGGKLFFPSLWSTCPANPIRSSIKGTGDHFPCTTCQEHWLVLGDVLLKELGVRKLAPESKACLARCVLHPYIGMCSYMFREVLENYERITDNLINEQEKKAQIHKSSAVIVILLSYFLTCSRAKISLPVWFCLSIMYRTH